MAQTITKAASAATPSLEDRLAALEAENSALKAQAIAKNRLTVKLAPSGGLSVYGLGRFPVTLYASGWERIFGGEIEELLTKAIAAATPLTDSNGQRLLAIKGEAFNKREAEGENEAANAQLQAAL